MALLLAIASAQMLLARTSDLSPWKGGGFGMFASVDETASSGEAPTACVAVTAARTSG